MRNKQKLLAIIVLLLSIAGVLLSLASYLEIFSNERLMLAKKKDNQGQKIEPKYTFYTELKHRKVESDSDNLTFNQPSVSLTSFQEENDGQVRYVIQFGSFSSELDARVHLRKGQFLRLPLRINYQQQKYHAQVGPLTNQSQAFAVIDRLKKKRLPVKMIQLSD